MSTSSQNSSASSNSSPLSPTPYLRFRDAILNYHGPEQDLGESANLKEVKIAWFGPHDPTSRLESSGWKAANLAVEEANQQGGFNGLPFRLFPCWTADPWGSGIAQLTRMIYNEQPIALLGSIDSPSTHLAEQIAAKAQLPLISPFTTDPSVTLAGVSWMFSCAPSDRAIAAVLAEDVLASIPEADHPWVLLSATDHESRMTSREVLREFLRRHRLPDFRYDVKPGGNAFDQQIEAIERIQSRAVVIAAGAEDAARMLITLRERAPDAAVFGIHTMGQNRFRQLAGRAAEGVRFPVLFVPDRANSAVRGFVDHFERSQLDSPDYTAALAYDATHLLVDAIRRSGLKRVSLRDALGQLTPRTGISGLIHWDGTGQNSRSSLCMGEIRGGNIVLCRSNPLTRK